MAKLRGGTTTDEVEVGSTSKAIRVALYTSGAVAYSDYSGALNVNISGGSSNVSGNYVNLAASGVGISHFSGALNINISGGSISTTPPAYQSGTLVGISGGNLALSGLIVSISGSPTVQTQVRNSGAAWTDVGISSGIATMWMPVGGMAGTTVLISGVVGANVSGSLQISGTVAVSGQVIITSGGIIMNISGGVTVSGGIRVSGTVEISGAVGLQIRNSGNVWSDIGHASGLTQYAVPISSGGVISISGVVGANVSGGVTISGGVTVSGFVGALSGGTIPVSIVSGNLLYPSGQTLASQLNFTQTKTTVSGAALITVKSGIAILQSVIPIFLSGPNPSNSGQVIRINDATSGMGAIASGIGVYSFDFGAHSGNIAGTPGAYPPIAVGMNMLCLSGIVVQGALNLVVTIGYEA